MRGFSDRYRTICSHPEAVYYLPTYHAKEWSNVSETAEIMSDCMACHTSTVRWSVDYRRIVEVKEIFGAFLLYYDANTYHLIFKRGFSSDQVSQFKDLIARAAG